MSSSAPVVPRDAATVVLVRDGRDGVEVYVLRRVAGMPFAGGMTAFPGGSVDRRDADAAVAWAGPPPEEWARAFGTGEPLARALLCAAVRETFEEAGVLLAGPSPDAVVDGSHPQWEGDRAALENREVSLAELLERRGLVLRADLLRPWAHWITPEGEPRRYDTRFYVAALPDGQVAPEGRGVGVPAGHGGDGAGDGAGDGGAADVAGTVTREADHVAWLRPDDALAQMRAGERPMLPPTIMTLREVAQYRTAAEVLAAGWSRTIAPIVPRLVLGPDGNRVELPTGEDLELPPGFPR